MAASRASFVSKAFCSGHGSLPSIGSAFMSVYPTIAIPSPPAPAGGGLRAISIGVPAMVAGDGGLMCTGAGAGWLPALGRPGASAGAGWLSALVHLATGAGQQTPFAATPLWLQNGGSLQLLFGVAAASGILYVTSSDTSGRDISVKDGDDKGQGQLTPPPPPPGPGDKIALVKLLYELQRNLQQLLDGDDFDATEADHSKKTHRVVILVKDLHSTRMAAEALLDEMKSSKDRQVEIILLQKISSHVAALEKKLGNKETVDKHWIVTDLESLMGVEVPASVLKLCSRMFDVVDFCRGKFMVCLFIGTLVSCRVGPVEGFQILMHLFEEARDEKRAKVEDARSRAERKRRGELKDDEDDQAFEQQKKFLAILADHLKKWEKSLAAQKKSLAAQKKPGKTTT